MDNRKYRLLNVFSPVLSHCAKQILSVKYYRTFHRKIDWTSPSLFYDKVLWLSMNTDTTQWSTLADKYAVRDYVQEKCGSEILNELYGVWDNVEDIDFDALPQSFILKVTNGCAANVIVRDKSQIDAAAIRKELKQWMNIDYGALTGQPHYSRIKPRVIAEKLLVQDGDPSISLRDYKFYCMDGLLTYCAVFSDRKVNSHSYSYMLYDMEWNAHPEFCDQGERPDTYTPRPQCFEKMKEIASTLSKGHRFVRVDLYCIDESPIFGELTFTPGLGGQTIEFEREIGDLIQL